MASETVQKAILPKPPTRTGPMTLFLKQAPPPRSQVDELREGHKGANIDKYITFGRKRDPCMSLFEKFKATFLPADAKWATIRAERLHLDRWSCAHAGYDPETGDLYNFNLEFGRSPTYRVFGRRRRHRRLWSLPRSALV
ncbi:hypothetical protein BDW75DRAFT_243112 [Aspergillus navahoensis]